MLHIATVHYGTDKWIDIQSRYIRKHIAEPYRVYACLNGIKGDYSGLFFSQCSEEGLHEEKLNFLAKEITAQAGEDDLLVFLDGDAFPIDGNLVPFVREKLANHRLLAIRRSENNGDIQPHPSFCATTVGFWNQIGGDWKSGHCWMSRRGESVSDVGGNLLKLLFDNGIDWFPLTRTNAMNLHPVWFGLYGDMIYHHGAGFRPRVSRQDSPLAIRAYGLSQRNSHSRRFLDRLIRFIGGAIVRVLLLRQSLLAERVYAEIARDENFFLRFKTAHRRQVD